MRQVGEAELVWNIRMALRGLSAGYRNDFKSGQPELQKRAEQSMAMKVAEQLRRYEILSDAPLPESSDLFSRAAFGRSNQPMLGTEDDTP